VGTLRFAHPTGRDERSLAMNREELVAAYTAPGRHYHNLAHIEDCLGALARVDNLSALDREILSEAIWWHDVAYDATRADNEELSARLAEQHVREDLRREVGRLIRLTKTHAVQPDDRLGAILISIDLSILGAEPARYDAYAAAIRQATIAPAAPKCSASSPHGRSSFPIRPSPRDMTGRPAKTSRANWLRCADRAVDYLAPRKSRLPISTPLCRKMPCAVTAWK
jgi:hypothetical protein